MDGGAGSSGSVAVVDMYPPVDLTPDGTVALLQDFSTVSFDVYLYDVATGVNTRKTQTGDIILPVFGIASTRRVVGFHGSPTQAALWDEDGGWRDLGNPFDGGCPPADESAGWDISADGRVVVGLAWEGCTTRAFRWTDGADGGFSVLGRVGGGTGNDRASVVSDDGRISAGFVQTAQADRTAAIWQPDGTGALLDNTGTAISEVSALNTDGRVAGGIWNMGAFIWTSDGGVVELGRLPESLPTEPAGFNALTADGRLAMGYSGDAFMGVQQAVYWTAARGLQPLQPVVTGAGVVLPEGYLLQNVVALSADGSTVLGIGQDAQGHQNTFILRLPVGAYGL